MKLAAKGGAMKYKTRAQQCTGYVWISKVVIANVSRFFRGC